MGISGGPSQVPALVLPHSEAGKTEFESSRKFDLSLMGVLGLIFLGISLAVSYVLARTTYWYVSVAILLCAAVFFLWPRTRRKLTAK